jgi:hypothetical protein
MGKMIKVNGIGYDQDKDQDLDVMWSGWLPISEIKILKKI